MTAPTAELLAICRSLIDPAAEAIRLHAGHNWTSVLRAATTAGDVIVKIHRSVERHQQEVHAYQHWVPALGSRAPQLLATSDNPPAIVVTCLSGVQLSEIRLSRQQEAGAYRQAGEALRILHAAAPPRLEPDMTAWLAERGEHWLALGRDLLSLEQRSTARTHLRELTQLAPIPAVPCHLDYMPRNLIVSPSTDIAVIDFEHSRYDLAARDLVRLATRIWPKRPDLKQAFVAGYGPLDELDLQVIRCCTDLDYLTSAVRAQSHAHSGRVTTP